MRVTIYLTTGNTKIQGKNKRFLTFKNSDNAIFIIIITINTFLRAVRVDSNATSPFSYNKRRWQAMIEQNEEIWSGNGCTNGRHGYGSDNDDQGFTTMPFLESVVNINFHYKAIL